MLKVGKISYWHVHADDYTRQVLNNPNAELIAIWDEIAERGKQKAEQYGVPFYASLDEFLAIGEMDAVVIDAPTNMHKEIMIKAAQAGKHIFTEKVIAPTYAEVREIFDAVDKAGIKFGVSLPRLRDGYTQTIQEIIDSGKLGKPTLVRVRLSHNGALAGWLPEHFYSLEQCAGGALIDLGCHPVYLVRKLMGEMPESVAATYGYVTGREVEDNATLTFKFAGGGIGIAEAGFVNAHSPFSIEVHGTDGTLLYGFPDSKLLYRSNLESNQSGWEEVPCASNAEKLLDSWVSNILNSTDDLVTRELGIQLTQLMEAANISAAEHRSVRIDELK